MLTAPAETVGRRGRRRVGRGEAGLDATRGGVVDHGERCAVDTPIRAAHTKTASAAAVDRDRQLEEHVLGDRVLDLERGDEVDRSGRGSEEAALDLPHVVEDEQLLLELPREASPAEVPAVELLQESCRTPLAELADGLAREEDELRDDLLAGRLRAVAVDDLAQRPRVPLRAAADHHRGAAGRREDGLGAGAGGDVARGDDGNV